MKEFTETILGILLASILVGIPLFMVIHYTIEWIQEKKRNKYKQWKPSNHWSFAGGAIPMLAIDYKQKETILTSNDLEFPANMGIKITSVHYWGRVLSSKEIMDAQHRILNDSELCDCELCERKRNNG
jgi:hypothetical protein